MKRILASFVFFVLLITIMATGITGSGAWFTDQVSMDNNTITTGNIDLVISEVFKSDPTLEPGADYQELLRFCVKNGGSYNMKWRGMFVDVRAPVGMVDQLLIRGVILSPLVRPTDSHETHHDDEENIWFKGQPAAALMKANSAILLDASTTHAPFKPNDQNCYSIQAKLPGSAGNEIMQAAFNATLQLDATQWISTESDWPKAH